MNIEDYREDKTTIDVPFLDVSEKKGPKLTDIIDEEIDRIEVEENKSINKDDFLDTDPPAGDPDAETDEDPEAAGSPPAKTDKPAAVDVPKNKAISNLMNTGTIITFYNVMAGRTGRIINSNNPDCLKLDAEDSEDLGVILKSTVEEENWSRFPTKYMLLIVVALIVIGKIFSWNKPAAKISAAAGSSAGDPEALRQLNDKLAGMERKFGELATTLDAVQKQNILLQGLLDKATGKRSGQPPVSRYKGHDLSNPNLFSENGALIDPSKAGQKGYSSSGKKMGIPSAEEADIYERWKAYQEWILEAA